jgi:aerobic C4-dicarboxylate transport protein
MTAAGLKSQTFPGESIAQKPKKAFYRTLWGQVLIAIAIAILLGYIRPTTAVAMKPLGDAFIRLITMIVTLIVFCTVVTGIAGMQDIKKVGRVGGKALLYFEVVSTVGLLIGLIVGNLVHAGRGFNAAPSTLDAQAVTQFAGSAKLEGVADFLMHIIPATVVDGFLRGDLLEVLLIAILFGFALSGLGQRGKPVINLVESLMQAVFGVVNIIMRFAPLGAFGAMAFTVGRYGLMSLGPLAKLMGAFSLTSILFVIVILGSICSAAGFGLVKFLSYIKEEIVIVLATASSETALPTLMRKLEKLGCSNSLVGLVIPTGYTFNAAGTSIYMTMAALFVAEATNTHLTAAQQLNIFAVALLTSKGASGVYGASFIQLVATLTVVPTIPVGGMALILGIDRFFSLFRATINMIGNGVATLVVARWEGEIDGAMLRRNLMRASGNLPPVKSRTELEQPDAARPVAHDLLRK